MNSEELLQWADDLVFTKAAKHLDSLQMAILEGAWQGLKYEEIAKKCHRSKSHVKNIAAELWQTLSDMLGEDINKVNARSILERKALSCSAFKLHTQNLIKFLWGGRPARTENTI